MQVISIPFGSAGASWFAVERTTKSGRLVGYRYFPEGGSWRRAAVDRVPENFTRQPQAARPAPPSADVLAKLGAKKARDTGNDKIRAAMRKPGAKVRITGRRWVYNPETRDNSREPYDITGAVRPDSRGWYIVDDGSERGFSFRVEHVTTIELV